MDAQCVTLKNGLEIVLKQARIEEFVPGDPMPEGVGISVHCGWDFDKGESNFVQRAPLFAAWHRAQFAGQKHRQPHGDDYGGGGIAALCQNRGSHRCQPHDL